MRNTYGGALLVWILSFLSSVAYATPVTVSPATYSVDAYVEPAYAGLPAGSDEHESGIYSATAPLVVNNTQCDEIVLSVCGTSRASQGILTEMAVGATSGEFNSGSSAILDLYYEVISPNNIQTQVPLLFSGSLEAVATGSYAFSQAFFATDAGGLINNSGFASVCAGAGSADSGSCATVAGGNALDLTNVPFSVLAGEQLYLQMAAFGSTNVSSGVPGSYTAVADPTISIDPMWLASNPGYSLVFSSNINMTSPPSNVPEPGTLVLAVLGLTGLGIARVRVKRG